MSELCLTAGTLVVLFVAYVLLWTGVTADRAMDGERARLRDRWAAAAPA
ncbi:sortase, partial [Streptomyces sp. RSD-27]